VLSNTLNDSLRDGDECTPCSGDSTDGGGIGCPENIDPRLLYSLRQSSSRDCLCLSKVLRDTRFFSLQYLEQEQYQARLGLFEVDMYQDVRWAVRLEEGNTRIH
jgi:hypothetical protein